MSDNITDLFFSTDTETTAIKTRKKHRKFSEEARAKISLAASLQDPEVVKKKMQKLGKKPKRMTEKRLANLRRQQETLATFADRSKGGLRASSNPINRRKSMRKFKCYVNLTDEEFEEKMKILDKKIEERDKLRAEQEVLQTTDTSSLDITSKDSSKDTDTSSLS